MKLLYRIVCAFRGQHVPARHPLGGFRCKKCGTAGANLEDMGFEDGYIVSRKFASTSR